MRAVDIGRCGAGRDDEEMDLVAVGGRSEADWRPLPMRLRVGRVCSGHEWRGEEGRRGRRRRGRERERRRKENERKVDPAL